jgi:hypothetical protein
VDYIEVKESKSEAEKNAAAPVAATEVVKSPAVNDEAAGAGSSEVIMKLAEQIANLKIENQSLRDSIIILKKNLKAARAASVQDAK